MFAIIFIWNKIKFLKGWSSKIKSFNDMDKSLLVINNFFAQDKKAKMSSLIRDCYVGTCFPVWIIWFWETIF